MRVRAFRRINLPADQVWEVLADHEGMSEWSPVVSAELERKGDQTPNGVGAVRSIRMLGMKIREQVTEFSPERRLGYRALSGIPLRDYAGEVVLAPDGASTGVTWVLSTTNRFPGTRLLLGVNARLFVRALQRVAERRFPASH